jgi:hypothetical protein
LRIEPEITGHIRFGIFMLATVNFDNQLVGETGKVGDVFSNRNLPFELVILKALGAKFMP